MLMERSMCEWIAALRYGSVLRFGGSGESVVQHKMEL